MALSPQFLMDPKGVFNFQYLKPGLQREKSGVCDEFSRFMDYAISPSPGVNWEKMTGYFKIVPLKSRESYVHTQLKEWVPEGK